MNSKIFRFSKNIILSLLAFAVILPLSACFSLNLADGHVPTAGYSEEATAVTDDAAPPVTSATEPEAGTDPVTDTDTDADPVTDPVTGTDADPATDPVTGTDAATDTEPVPDGMTAQEIDSKKDHVADMINRSHIPDIQDYFSLLLSDYRITYPESVETEYHNVQSGDITDMYRDGSAIYSISVDGMRCEVEESGGKFKVTSVYPDQDEATDVLSYIGFDVNSMLPAPFFEFPEISTDRLSLSTDEDGSPFFKTTDEYTGQLKSTLRAALGYAEDDEAFVINSAACTYDFDSDSMNAVFECTNDILGETTVSAVQQGVMGEDGIFTISLSGIFGGEFGYVPTTVTYSCRFYDDHGSDREETDLIPKAEYTLSVLTNISEFTPGIEMDITYETTDTYTLDPSGFQYHVSKEDLYSISTEDGTDRSSYCISADIEADGQENYFILKLSEKADDLEGENIAATLSFDPADVTTIPEKVTEAAKAAIDDPTLIEDSFPDFP